MATYEVLLFATLAARRLGAPQAAVRAMLVAGILLYAGESAGTQPLFTCSQLLSAADIACCVWAVPAQRWQRYRLPGHIVHFGTRRHLAEAGQGSSATAAPCARPAATRVLQAVVLASFFKGSYGQLAGCDGLGIWWAMLLLTSTLLVIQAYTFRIYAGVWRRHRQGLPTAASSRAPLSHTMGASSSSSMSPKPSDSTGTLSTDSV